MLDKPGLGIELDDAGRTQCRTIARLGAGTDRIAADTATRKGTVVSNVPDVCLGEQADHTMTLLLVFARRSAGFGLKLIDGTRSPQRYRAISYALGVRMAALDDLLSQSHFVSIHLPLLPQARYLLGARELARMQSPSIPGTIS